MRTFKALAGLTLLSALAFPNIVAQTTSSDVVTFFNILADLYRTALLTQQPQYTLLKMLTLLQLYHQPILLPPRCY